MLASAKLENKVKECLEKNLKEIAPKAVEGEQPVGDFISILIPILLPLIQELIASLTDKCLSKNGGDVEAVSGNLMQNTFLTRYVIRQGVYKSEIPREHQEVSRKTIMDVMSGNKKEDVVQWVEEVNSVIPDWSLFS